MYYEERLINGKWYFKSLPRAEWIEMRGERLAKKLLSLQLQQETF